MPTPNKTTDDLIHRRSDMMDTYEDSDGVLHDYPVMGQGPAVVVSKEEDGDITVYREADYERDVTGFTNPNLHRRTDPGDPPTPTDPNYDPTKPGSVDRSYLNQEIQPRSYEFTIGGVHSYRTVTMHVHDEESIDSEIP